MYVTSLLSKSSGKKAESFGSAFGKKASSSSCTESIAADSFLRCLLGVLGPLGVDDGLSDMVGTSGKQNARAMDIPLTGPCLWKPTLSVGTPPGLLLFLPGDRCLCVFSGKGGGGGDRSDSEDEECGRKISSRVLPLELTWRISVTAETGTSFPPGDCPGEAGSGTFVGSTSRRSFRTLTASL